MYKIKIYKNGKLFAEYDVEEYMLMDKEGKAFVSTGEDPQSFIMNAIRREMGGMDKTGDSDGDVIDGPAPKERKTPNMKDKMALKLLISKMDKEDH